MCAWRGDCTTGDYFSATVGADNSPSYPNVGRPLTSARSRRPSAEAVIRTKRPVSSFSTPRRLLVITYHFPPDGAVGGLRWAGLSKYLARRGWDIHVITAADQKDRPQVPGVTVHHCPRSRTINDVYKDWVTGRRARMSAAAPAAAAAKGASQPVAASGGECAPRNESIRERTRRTLGAAIAFPDYARGWVFRAAALAQSLQTSVTFDVVVSSGPPHSAHIAGVLACFGRHSTYVADLRDPWSPTAGAQALNNSRWMGATLAGLERIVFARANRVIVNTPEFAGVLRTTKPALAVSIHSQWHRYRPAAAARAAFRASHHLVSRNPVPRTRSHAGDSRDEGVRGATSGDPRRDHATGRRVHGPGAPRKILERGRRIRSS